MRETIRIEQLRAECNKFQGEKECYMHCEKTTNGNYAILIGGDVETIFTGIYYMLCRLSAITTVEVKEWAKMLVEACKIGKGKTTLASSGRLERHTQSERFSLERERLNREINRLKVELEDTKRISSEMRLDQMQKYNKLDAQYVKVCRELRADDNKICKLTEENEYLKRKLEMRGGE